MTWGISTQDLKRISSFVAAERHWNEAAPWKKEHTSWRQLAGRRKIHMRLVKLSEDRGYECVLYNTAIVTYMADGSVKLRCYNTPSTQAFAWHVTPNGIAPVSVGGQMLWKVQTDQGEMFYCEGKEALHLKLTEKGNWLLVTEPEQFKEKVYVPEAGAQVRKMLKGYRTWYDTTKRLGVPLPSYNPKFHRVDSSVTSFFIEPDGPQPDEFMMIANQLGDPNIIKDYLYQTRGAYIEVPAPFDRLPRIST